MVPYVAERVTESVATQLKSSIPIINQAGDLANVAIDTLSSAATSIATGEPLRFSAGLHNQTSYVI